MKNRDPRRADARFIGIALGNLAVGICAGVAFGVLPGTVRGRR